MKKISGKELRQNTENTIKSLLSQLEIDAPSKRTRKIVEKVSRRLSKGLKQEMKKQLKKNQKATRKTKVTSLKSSEAKTSAA
jgi:hypothetical protein